MNQFPSSGAGPHHQGQLYCEAKKMAGTTLLSAEVLEGVRASSPSSHDLRMTPEIVLPPATGSEGLGASFPRPV